MLALCDYCPTIPFERFSMHITGVTEKGIAIRPSQENGLFVIRAGVVLLCGIRGIVQGVHPEDLAEIWDGNIEAARKYVQPDANALGRYALLGEATKLQLIVSAHSRPLYGSGSFTEYDPQSEML